MQTDKIFYLDGWRGAAILAVLLGHFSGTPKLGWLGPFGVVLFFGLSGRLMCDLLFIKQVSLKPFFQRRFSRVLPTFILFVLSMAVYARLMMPGGVQWDARELLPTLLFLRSYLPHDISIWQPAWPIGHLWSLNVEEHSYIYLAAGALLLRQLNSRTAALLFLLATSIALLAVIAWYGQHPPSGASPWHLRTECAALGIVAAAAIRLFAAARPQPALPGFGLAPLLAVAIAALCFAKYEHRGVHLWVAPLCIAFAVNYLGATPAALRRLLSSPAMCWFGRCSFSLYLWQQPFFAAIKQGGLHPALALLGAVGVGALSFYLYEDPIRQYLNAAFARRNLPALAPNNA